ncbi:hypothetical protein FWG86_00060 [Candidatus Saccharibacteria bacterium]|nr:hypothetical protein [Candidatus Saccharibacteria bacterium]
MSTKVICIISKGPSRSTLIDAFKYALISETSIPVRFTCPGNALTFTHSATILGLEYAAKDNDSVFRITGKIGLMGGVPASFVALYDARNQTGTLIHRGGHPVGYEDLEQDYLEELPPNMLSLYFRNAKNTERIKFLNRSDLLAKLNDYHLSLKNQPGSFATGQIDDEIQKLVDRLSPTEKLLLDPDIILTFNLQTKKPKL